MFLGGVFDFAARAAQAPAAWPVAMEIGMIRNEARAWCEPEMHRPARRRLSIFFGMRHRSGMEYDSSGRSLLSMVPEPAGLWMSMGYEPQAMVSSNFFASRMSSSVRQYSQVILRDSRTPTFVPLWAM